MPKVGNKTYAYTKKGKAAAAKARQEQERGPMPKVNPEFAKEMEEANKPKPLPYKKKEIRAHPHLGPQGPAGEELKKVLARRKLKEDLKKKHGTIGAAPKKKKEGERSVDVQAGQEATRSKVRKTKAPRGRKKRLDPQSRHFRGRG